MVDTIKFSDFANGGDLANDNTTVGLESGVNTRFNNPWTFLAPGTTGDRPIPATAMYYRLRLNTTLEIYEYYDPTIPIWVELSGSGTGTVNPGVANDLAFYAASGQSVSPIAGAVNSVLVTNGSEVPSLSTTLPSGLSIPGALITASTAALLSGSVIAAPVSGNDLVNKTYADGLFGSGVQSLTGTTNQIIFSSPTGNVTASLPQDIALGSTPTFAGMTLSSIPLGSSSGGTGINNGSSTLTLAGSLATIGAFPSNFTMTGATNVTYPTSGTLATTSQITPQKTTLVSSTPYNVLTTDDIILVDTAAIGGTSSIVLPAAPTRDGQVWTIKDFGFDASTYPITISVSGGGDIDGNSTYTLADDNSAISIAWSVSQTTYSTVYALDAFIPVLRIAGNSGAAIPVTGVVTVSGGTTGLTTSGSGSTLSLTGVLIPANGGTGVNNGSSTLTMAGSHTLAGAFASTFTFTAATNVTLPISGTLATTAQLPTGAALTKTDDTNVTLTLGGTPATALLQATSLTMGWTGQLSLARGGTAASLTASNGGIVYSNATTLAILAGTATAGLALLSGASGAPTWSSNSPITKISIQHVTASGAGTYTPTAGMQYIIVQAQAGGGGGGGAATTIAAHGSAGGGGSGGEYIEAMFTAAQIGASKSFSIGAGGSGGTAGNNAGTVGGNTTFNTTYIITTGGNAGGGGPDLSLAAITSLPVVGGNGGSVATGTLLKQNPGGNSSVGVMITPGMAVSANGGASGSGAGGPIGLVVAASPGNNAIANSGAGGSGAVTNNGTQQAGGNGGSGYITFIEFLSV